MYNWMKAINSAVVGWKMWSCRLIQDASSRLCTRGRRHLGEILFHNSLNQNNPFAERAENMRWKSLWIQLHKNIYSHPIQFRQRRIIRREGQNTSLTCACCTPKIKLLSVSRLSPQPLDSGTPWKLSDNGQPCSSQSLKPSVREWA